MSFAASNVVRYSLSMIIVIYPHYRNNLSEFYSNYDNYEYYVNNLTYIHISVKVSYIFIDNYYIILLLIFDGQFLHLLTY